MQSVTGYRCLACNDMHVRELRRIPPHEDSNSHKDALKYYLENLPPSESSQPSDLSMSAFVSDGLLGLLDSLAAPAGYHAHTSTEYREPHLPPHPRLLDWGLSENTELESSPEAQAVAQIAQKLSDYLTGENSDEETEERSDDEDDKEEVEEPTVTGMLRLQSIASLSLTRLQLTMAMRRSI